MKITTNKMLAGIGILFITACGVDSSTSGGSNTPRVKEVKIVNENDEVLVLRQVEYVKGSKGKRLPSKLTLISYMNGYTGEIEKKGRKFITNMEYNKDDRTSKWTQKSYDIKENGDEEFDTEYSLLWTYDVDKKTAHGKKSNGDSMYDVVFMDSDFSRIKERYKFESGKRRLTSQYSYKKEGATETQIHKDADGRVEREEIVEKVTDKIWALKKRIYYGPGVKGVIEFEHNDEIGTSSVTAAPSGLLQGSAPSNFFFTFLFGRYAVRTSSKTVLPKPLIPSYKENCNMDNEYNSNDLLIKQIETCEKNGKSKTITIFFKYE